MTVHSRLTRLLLLLCLLTGLLIFTTAARAQHPADHWEFSVQTGYLKKVKNNSPFDYRIVPTQAVWRSPTVFDLRGKRGGKRGSGLPFPTGHGILQGGRPDPICRS